MRIVAILNQKGGVGKTTTSVNLGAALALAGRRVLLIDIDPQANLTDHLGVDASVRGVTTYDVLTDGAPVSDAVVETETPGLFVLPADGDLAAAEQELATEIAREMRLQRALAGVDESTYDYVLIDCPPSLGLLSLNAMAAADELIVTVQTEYFAMRGLGQIDQIVEMVREHVNPRLRVRGILPTLVSPVTRLAREVIEEIQAHYGALVFTTRIRQNVRLAEAPGHQMHIFAYDPTSAGAADYHALAQEVDAPPVAQAVPAPTPAGDTQADGNGETAPDTTGNGDTAGEPDMHTESETDVSAESETDGHAEAEAERDADAESELVPEPTPATDSHEASSTEEGAATVTPDESADAAVLEPVLPPPGTESSGG